LLRCLASPGEAPYSLRPEIFRGIFPIRLFDLSLSITALSASFSLPTFFPAMRSFKNFQVFNLFGFFSILHFPAFLCRAHLAFLPLISGEKATPLVPPPNVPFSINAEFLQTSSSSLAQAVVPDCFWRPNILCFVFRPLFSLLPAQSLQLLIV